MNHNDGGSQSRFGVLMAILFFVLTSAMALWMLISGPNETSVFFFLRSPVFFYPVSLVCLIGSLALIWLGIKRFRSLP